MSSGPDDPAPGAERVADAISDGAPVDWDAERTGGSADAETLDALRLIDRVARVHRGGIAPEAEPEQGAAEPLEAWGSLRIVQPLGVGAYGDVYRAVDPALRREVALKLWRTGNRPRTIERLLDEARALASVRHPNVLLVHGADVHEGRAGMWTELLEGATLEEILQTYGPLGWREAALAGIELCRALAAVHALGLVHGDVKTANVMRERGGRIVLMDFGSASAIRDGSEAVPMLQGTPLAMAPELLREEPATPASDLYSLGVLLWRLVTGRYPCEADSLEALRAKLAAEPLPSLRSERPDLPEPFARVVAHALERVPAERPASAAAMERELSDVLRSDWSAPAAEPVRPHKRRRALAAVAALVTAAALGAGAWNWWLAHGPAAGTPHPLQFTLQLPVGQHLNQWANVTVSPDGGTIAFAAQDTLGRFALWIRRLDDRESTRLPGTDGAQYPFWSPDSREVAFFSGTSLKRVALDGGPARTICATTLGRGGTWGRHGTILFAASTQGPIFRVPAAGGTPMPATVVDAAAGEVSHRWPSFLPDGERFLYVSTPARDGTYALYAGSLGSDRRAFVGPVESGAAYSCGQLVYLANETIQTRPFNLRTLAWSGDPRPISDARGSGGSIAEPHASASQNGILVYPSTIERTSRLQWIDTRNGVVSPLGQGAYFYPSVSPDGRRVAVERVESAARSNIWLLDAATGAAERWTDATGLNRKPVWSATGDSIAFASNRDGRYSIYVRAVGGALAERRLARPAPGLLLWPDDWYAPGVLAFDAYHPATSFDVFELRGDSIVTIADGSSPEAQATYSPDGRWLAYEGGASGERQVYVVERSTGTRYRVSPHGGYQPRWARRTGQLFFHDAGGRFYVSEPRTGATPDRWTVTQLAHSGFLEGWDVSPDGRRLLVCLRTETTRPEEVVVLANLPQAIAHGL